MTAYLAGQGPYERLSLTATQIRQRATPRLYDVPLAGLEGDITAGPAPSTAGSTVCRLSRLTLGGSRGAPTPFAGGENERLWKQAIAERVPPCPGGSNTSAHIRFVLQPEQDGSTGGDLDNLLDPILSVLVNKLGWCGGRRPTLQWVAASKRFTREAGAHIEVGGDEPPWPPASAGPVVLDGDYAGPLPRSATAPEFADWVRGHMAAVLADDDRAAVRLSFASDTVNLGEIATGTVKPLIDGLWPLLGGSPAAPEDWRVRALHIEKGVEAQQGVAVRVAQLPIDPP